MVRTVHDKFIAFVLYLTSLLFTYLKKKLFERSGGDDATHKRYEASRNYPVDDPICMSASALEDMDAVRQRVRARIMKRVHELERQRDGCAELRRDDYYCRETAQAVVRSLNDDAEKALEHLRHDVIDVAAQILERCLQPQRRSSNTSIVVDHTVELRLVHRMLTKESELLALQPQLPVSSAAAVVNSNNNTSNHERQSWIQRAKLTR